MGSPARSRSDSRPPAAQATSFLSSPAGAGGGAGARHRSPPPRRPCTATSPHPSLASCCPPSVPVGLSDPCGARASSGARLSTLPQECPPKGLARPNAPVFSMGTKLRRPGAGPSLRTLATCLAGGPPPPALLLWASVSPLGAAVITLYETSLSVGCCLFGRRGPRTAGTGTWLGPQGRGWGRNSHTEQVSRAHGASLLRPPRAVCRRPGSHLCGPRLQGPGMRGGSGGHSFVFSGRLSKQPPCREAGEV